MKFVHGGNKKLGPTVSTLSRGVGTSCPNTCSLLKPGGGCYAKALQATRPSLRTAWLSNERKSYDYKELRSFLVEAACLGNSVRYHVGGDFLKTNAAGSKILDLPYLRAIARANKELRAAERPQQFLYTHVYDARIVRELADYVVLYASCDSYADRAKAQRAGFVRFATVVDGKDVVGRRSVDGVPLCWEQLGTKSNCSSCGYCIKGLGDIVFIKH